MFRQPILGLAEIAWRWSFGFASSGLLAFCFIEYLDTLPVTSGDMLLLRSRQPFLISQAAAHILRGSAARLVWATVVLAPALAIAWIVIAALGRTATLTSLLADFRSDNRPASPVRFRSLMGLNFLRVTATVAAAVGCLAAFLLGGAASPTADPAPGSAMLVFLTVVMLVGLAWSAVNWFLSLASIFVVRDGENTFGAITSTIDLCRTQIGPILATGTWFGLAHAVVFVGASSVVAFPLAFATVLPTGVVLGGVLLVTLLYFAIADFLYVGRLAAFVAILEAPAPDSTEQSTSSLPPTQSAHLPTLYPKFDDDDNILSDIPGLIPPPQPAES